MKFLFLFVGGSHFRFNNYESDFVLENTQLGGEPYEPMLGSSTIHNPITLDGIIGPSAAATFIHGKKTLVFFNTNAYPSKLL